MKSESAGKFLPPLQRIGFRNAAMHHVPRLSVLIPTRDRRALLTDCLASLRKQSYQNFEIILVDDGSSDGTEVLAPTVDIYVRTPPLGVGHARNLAISLAHGEFFYVLDSDDWLSDDALTLSVTAIDQSGADMVFSDLNLVQDGVVVGRFGACVQTASEVLESKRIPHGSSLIRRSTLNVRYDERLRSAEDLDFLLRYLPGKKVVQTPHPVYYYRLHDGQENQKAIQSVAAREIRSKYAVK